jgi:DNA-binding response OmpR family regulator
MTMGASRLKESEIEKLVLKEVGVVQNDEPSLQVLIVDADPECVANVAAVVLSEGHLANKCHDLKLALKIAEILKPHLILIDAALISQTGMELYPKLRNMLVGATIVATGWGSDQQLALAKLDFDYRLNHPTSPTVLREILQAVEVPTSEVSRTRSEPNRVRAGRGPSRTG